MEWIVTDDTSREAWRRLLEFANIDLAVDAIIARHGAPSSARVLENYKKQARQIRVSLLQAKEYFDAANSSSIFTSPNHLYYGFVALTSALMLVLGDGSKSLEVLRRDKGNGNHGLMFSTTSDSKKSSKDVSILSESMVEICAKGFFSNWYSTMPRNFNIHAIRTISSTTSQMTSMAVVGFCENYDIKRLVGSKISLLDLLLYLPDLYADLQRYGIRVPSSRTSYKVNVTDDRVVHQWRIHNAGSAEDLEKLLSAFTVDNRYIDCISFSGLETSGIVEVSHLRDENFHVSWPDSRYTLDFRHISYADGVRHHELTDSFLCSYQLSMLSRYYPDLWISCIESQCRAAKLVERVVDVLVKKVPMIVLSELSPGGVFVSTQSEPWRSI